MLNESQIKELEKQSYRLVGNHSAVKVCEWTKKMVRGEGGCYKFKFYGIRSHQCLQMTTSMFCANRCTFCWRGEKAPVSKNWYGPVDEPDFIIDNSIEKQFDLLLGFKGNPKAKFYNQSNSIRHVALSLTGEPITYPRLNELLKKFHERKISTFLVTNAQFPEQIEKLENVTQLYISLDAPNKEDLKKIDRPLFPDYYERLLASLDAMAKKKFRTCIRLTLVKGWNDCNISQYAELIKRGNPDFIEVKGYVWVGAAQKVHTVQEMPWHEEVLDFSDRLAKELGNYEVISSHQPSNVACLIRKDLSGKRYINFPKFFEIVNSGGIAETLDYSSEIMQSNA